MTFLFFHLENACFLFLDSNVYIFCARMILSGKTFGRRGYLRILPGMFVTIYVLLSTTGESSCKARLAQM